MAQKISIQRAFVVSVKRSKSRRVTVSVTQHQPRVVVLKIHRVSSIRGVIFGGKANPKVRNYFRMIFELFWYFF
jgi:hypothetical protein